MFKGALKTHEINTWKETPDTPFPWKREDLGYFPHAKSDRTLFYNSVLPKYYDTVFEHKSCPQTFKKAFFKEATREWQILQEIKNVNDKIAACIIMLIENIGFQGQSWYYVGN